MWHKTKTLIHLNKNILRIREKAVIKGIGLKALMKQIIFPKRSINIAQVGQHSKSKDNYIITYLRQSIMLHNIGIEQ